MCVGSSYLPPRFVVVQVHENSGILSRPARVILLPLLGIDKFPRKSVAIMHVVATASPQPVAWQIAGPGGAAAATCGELAVAARPTDGVDDTGRADGVRECRLP